ncbi:MAG: protein-L-isoaspartate O-methyltransferase, partial [Eubacteriales bacterium]|nr:protein-L-isoaspartate O-methyltransferase [Eubacteriales bacterium]
GYQNISYKTGDGSAGWPEESPFDRIIVTAAAAEVPSPLVKQLRLGGRIVIPVGKQLMQELLLIIKEETGIKEQKLGGCRFVPLV